MEEKLNVVNEIKVLSIEQYFGEMRLPKKDIKKRIDMCEDFEVFLLYIIELGDELQNLQLEILISELQRGMIEIAGNHIELTEAILDRINEDAVYIAETTIENLETPFFTSPDRARLVAENETQAIFNLSEFERAKEQGFVYKEWLAMLDEKTRPTHALADGQKVGIDTPFIVGDSLMMFPNDTSLGASPEEIINCRCVMRYTRNP